MLYSTPFKWDLMQCTVRHHQQTGAAQRASHTQVALQADSACLRELRKMLLSGHSPCIMGHAYDLARTTAEMLSSTI